MADKKSLDSVPKKEENTKNESVKLSDTWSLVKKSWETFVPSWRSYVAYQLLALIGLIIPVIALMVVFFKDNLSELRSYASMGSDMEPEKVWELMKDFFTNPLVLVLMLIIFVISVLINLGYAKYVYQKFVGKNELTIKESLSYSFSNFLPYLGVSLLVGLSVLAGIIVLVVPGLVLAVWFTFYTVVFIAEDLRGVAVLKRSKELVSGYFWPVVGRLLLFFVSTSVIDNLLAKISEQNGAISIILTPIQIAFSFVISVLGIIFIYQIYSELKEIKK